MLRSKWSAGLAVLVGALAFVAVAGASAGSADPSAGRDAASTRTFIAGELAIQNAMLANGPAELAAAKPYVSALETECGDVRLRLPRHAGAKRVLVYFQFLIEFTTAYQDVAMAPTRPTIDRTARVQERLRFSDPALQWTVHGSTPALAAMLALRPPDACADARRLAATKFRALTPAGRQFASDALTLAAGEGGPAALMRRMRSYDPAAVAAGLRRLKTLDHRVSKLPVTRLEISLLRRWIGTNSGSPASARVRTVVGSFGRSLE